MALLILFSNFDETLPFQSNFSGIPHVSITQSFVLLCTHQKDDLLKKYSQKTSIAVVNAAYCHSTRFSRLKATCNTTTIVQNGATLRTRP